MLLLLLSLLLFLFLSSLATGMAGQEAPGVMAIGGKRANGAKAPSRLPPPPPEASERDRVDVILFVRRAPAQTGFLGGVWTRREKNKKTKKNGLELSHFKRKKIERGRERTDTHTHTEREREGRWQSREHTHTQSLTQ